jgi:hypothetical protein
MEAAFGSVLVEKYYAMIPDGEAGATTPIVIAGRGAIGNIDVRARGT